MAVQGWGEGKKRGGTGQEEGGSGGEGGDWAQVGGRIGSTGMCHILTPFTGQIP